MRKLLFLALLQSPFFPSIIAQTGTGYEHPNAIRTGKTERPATVLAQKDVELITGAYQYSLDGKYLKNLTLTYLDFAKGSFRGTVFENVNLRYSIGFKKALGANDNDFTHTSFEGTTLLNYCRFTNWRMQNCQFNQVRIDSSLFTNSILENCTFTGGIFSNSTITHTTGSSWNNTVFQANCSFVNLNFNKANLINLRSATMSISYSNITDSYINNWSFSGTPMAGMGRLEGVNFLNDSVVNMNLQYYKVVGRDSLNFLCTFTNCAFSNLRLQNSEVGAVFNDVRWKIGLVTSTNFLNSIFNRVDVTGGTGPSLRVTFNNCNFSRCTFNGPVTFSNCDFTACTWPPTPKPQNVIFSNCTGSVWN